MQGAPTPVRDFISVEDAITLIKGHRADAPTILPSKLRLTYLYCKPNNNITLFQAKLGKMASGRLGAVATAPVFVRINTTLEAETLKQVIKDKVQELSHEEFRPNQVVRRKTTNEEGNGRCIMKDNPEVRVKVGDSIQD